MSDMTTGIFLSKTGPGTKRFYTVAHKGHARFFLLFPRFSKQVPPRLKPLHRGENVSTAVETFTLRWERYLLGGNVFSAVTYENLGNRKKLHIPHGPPYSRRRTMVPTDYVSQRYPDVMFYCMGTTDKKNMEPVTNETKNVSLVVY